ncbi:hypothetical protein O9929_23255 [Vibrio lentus]|nr:hypothetical protein [Vibrio lentus]
MNLYHNHSCWGFHHVDVGQQRYRGYHLPYDETRRIFFTQFGRALKSHTGALIDACCIVAVAAGTGPDRLQACKSATL